MAETKRITKTDCPHPKWARQTTPGHTATYCSICGGNLNA